MILYYTFSCHQKLFLVKNLVNKKQLIDSLRYVLEFTTFLLSKQKFVANDLDSSLFLRQLSSEYVFSVVYISLY